MSPAGYQVAMTLVWLVFVVCLVVLGVSALADRDWLRAGAFACVILGFGASFILDRRGRRQR
jgi:hypothetical protein